MTFTYKSLFLDLEYWRLRGKTTMNSWKPWFLRARLKTRHLMLISAIGQEGNINKAAERLSMSQPAASRLLRDLEEIVGADLFDRLPRGVRANWYGETMIRHARNALMSLNEAAGEIESIKAGCSGVVSLGAIPGPGISLVPRAVSHVAADYPLMRIQLLVDTSERLLDAIDDGRIDIMVGRLTDRSDTSGYTFTRLAEEPICVAGRVGHPLVTKTPFGFADLAAASWIVPPIGTVLRERFDHMFRDANLAVPRKLIETASLMVAMRLLEETDFIATFPRELAEYYSRRGLMSIVPVELKCDMDAYGVITRRGWLLSPAAQIIREALEDAAASPGMSRAVAATA
jgi:DNA-binding transcriptional LysR family regulator